MNFTPQRGLRLRLLAAACQHTCLCELLAERPKPAQKAVRALDARARPFERRVGRRAGGGAKIVNRRTVSAPYWSISVCGSTPLFFDFDIFSMPPASTGWPS